MKRNIPILKIKDLALLKSHPEEYYLTKTHDGTSSGPLRTGLNDFIGKYADSNYKQIEVLNKEGKHAGHVQGIYAENIRVEELEEMGVTDAHIIQNDGGSLFFGPEQTRIQEQHDAVFIQDNERYTFPLLEEMDQLTLQNEDGEYYLRSTTVTDSYAGGSITLMRTNKFNEENHEEFRRVADAFEKESREWKLEYTFGELAKEKELWNEYRDETGIWLGGEKSTHPERQRIRKEAEKMMQEEMGSYREVFTKKYGPQFEACNIKLKIRRNSDAVPGNNGEDRQQAFRDRDVVDEYMGNVPRPDRWIPRTVDELR